MSQKITLRVRGDPEPRMRLVSDAVVIGGESDIGEYSDADEDYEVVPTVGEQVLPTGGKRMMKDVTVHGVPITAVSNAQGGRTVTIL